VRLTLAFWKLKFRLLSRFQDRSAKTHVPEMRFEEADGTPVSVSDRLAGKKGALLWMTNLCEDCRRRTAFLQEIHAEYGDRIGILAVSVLTGDRETPAEVRRTLSFGFGLLEDPADEIANVLGYAHPPGACPLFNLLLFDANGKIRHKTHLSAVKDDKLREELAKLL